MIRIKQNLQRRIDEIESVNLHIKESIDIGIITSKDEIEQGLYDLLGEKARWFEAKPDATLKTVSIGPTKDTESDSEKMRYVAWAKENYSDEISRMCSDVIKANIMKNYRGGVL